MRSAALAAGLAALALSACGGGGGSSGSSAGLPATQGGGPPAGTTVDMTDALRFEPKRITIRAGQTITWRNTGTLAHTVTTLKNKAANPADASVPAAAKAWDSGLVGGGRSYRRKLTVPGTYRYFCIPHEGAGMVGTIVVR